MGYTVYWSYSGTPMLNAQQFDALASMLSLNANQYSMKNRQTKNHIVVDGDCESFAFVADAIIPYGFCKTRGGDYTTPLVTSLIWLMLSHSNMSVTHDGLLEDMMEEWLNDDLFEQLSGGVAPDRAAILRMLRDRDKEGDDEDMESALRSFVIRHLGQRQ